MAKKTPHHTVLDLEFLPRKPRKAELTQIRILEAAIKCYSSAGFDAATFEKIGEVAGVSRPLIIRYFSDRQKLLLDAIHYIRHLFQNRAVEAMKGLKPGRPEIAAYVSSTFDWIEHDREHAVVWILFYYHCAFTKEFKQLNSSFVRTGEQRLEELLKRAGATSPKLRGKQIQIVITGALMSLMTEEAWDELATIRRQTIDLCLAITELP